MKHLLLACALIFSIPIHSSAYSYQGTINLENWTPPRGTNGPEIRAITLKWRLNDNNGQPEGSYTMQWYLGDFYVLDGEKVDLRELGESVRQLSIQDLVLEADFRVNEQKVADFQVDMGATPPHGGTWGQEVRYLYEWDKMLTFPESDSLMPGDSIRAFFEQQVELQFLRIQEISFGGTYAIERRIRELKSENAYQSALRDGDRALEFNQYEKAIAFYEQANQLNPGQLEVADRIKRAKYAQALAQGDAALETGDPEGAIEFFQVAERLLPNETAPKQRIALAKEQLAKAAEFEQLQIELKARYRVELEKVSKKQNQAIQDAVVTLDAETEACQLEYAEYFSCLTQHYQQKLQTVPDEARYLVYDDVQSRVKSEHANLCIKPLCNRFDDRSDSLEFTSVQYLGLAKRKFNIYEQTRYELFMERSLGLLEKSLVKDPANAEAYLFRANFAPTLMAKLMDAELALKYKPGYEEAIRLKESLQEPFLDELYDNIRRNNQVYVKEALSRGLMTTLDTHKGFTPLQWAVHHDQPDMLALLMANAMVARSTDPLNQELLLMAAKENKPATAEYLMTHGVSLSIPDEEGKSALLIATENNSREVVELFLEENQEELDATSSVVFSAEKGNVSYTELFLAAGANPNSVDAKGDNLLMLSIQYGHRDLIGVLLQAGADVNFVNPQGFTPLAYASQKREASVIENLLSYKADAKKALEVLNRRDPESGLYLSHRLGMYALEKKDKDQLKIALRANPQLPLQQTPSSSQSFLRLSIDRAEQEMTNLMLDVGDLEVNQPIDGEILLITALRLDQLMVAEKLLREKYASMDVYTDDKESPLHLAVANGNRSIVDLLLEKKHPLNVQDIRGNTPLHQALLNGQGDIAELLIKVGTDLSIPDKRGWKAIHIAAKLKDVQRVKAMIAAKADVNTTGESGMTALHYAAENSDRIMAEYLLSVGADREIEDYFHRTASKVARQQKAKELAKVLK
ncbi:MAG: ankyrin repeat domain-containing protein [Bacteroidota bacterium]